jgi:hypothetical protein
MALGASLESKKQHNTSEASTILQLACLLWRHMILFSKIIA